MNLLFLTLISFSLAFGLRLNDVCKMNESQCKGRYDSDFQYKEYCEKECIGKQMYKCTLNHCAIDKKSCQNFIHLNQVVKSINRLQVFNKELEKYKASLNSNSLLLIRFGPPLILFVIIFVIKGILLSLLF